MPRLKKILLSNILPLEELNPRDPKAAPSKAKGDALVKLNEELRETLIYEAKQDASEPAQGLAMGNNIPPLVVCKPPVDLPGHYRSDITSETYVLVDGYQRYEAIRDAFGLDIRVSIKIVETPSLVALMREAMELNSRPQMPLTKGEKLSHVFRLLLLDGIEDGTAWRKQFEGIASRSTLSEYKRLATFARDEANLHDLPFDEAREALREAVREGIGEYVTPRFDSKGFPTKSTISAWREVVETGDVSKWWAKKQAEREKSEAKKREAARSLSAMLAEFAPRERLEVLRRLEAEAKEEQRDAPRDAELSALTRDLKSSSSITQVSPLVDLEDEDF